MRPVPIEVELEGFKRVTVAGPDGDLMGEIRPVDALVGDTVLGPAYHMRIRLEEDDLKRIAAGETDFWLVLYGTRIQPFMLAFE